jgi:Ca-activated chloride channel family protein
VRTTRPSSSPPGAALALLAVALLLGLQPMPAGAEPDDVPGAAGAGEMVLVLDASGSMTEPHGDGRTRFEAAVAALRQVVGSLPGDLRVGLRVYGSRVSDGPGSCQDSELVAPVAPLDRRALRTALGEARPLGNTPIAYSLREAAADLPDEGARTIVLVSDGEESCGGDPCAVARDLSQQGLDLHVDVVGFQVDDAARNQLTCVAQAGRGTFYDAPDAAALASQLSRLSARAARAYEPQGSPVEGGDDAAGAPQLDPGRYLDTIGDGGETETYLVGPAAGSSVHLSATDRPTNVSLSDSEQVEIVLSSSEGDVCTQARGVGTGAFDRLTPITAAVTVSGEELGRCGTGPYVVSVNRVDGSGVKPLEVTYLEEPGVSDTAALPEPARSGEHPARGAVTGAPSPVFGSPSFTAAPLLEPGVYEDSILVGETLFYGVELDWGQQLVCDVEFGRSRSVNESLGSRNPTATVRAYGPLHVGFFDASQLERDHRLFNASRAVRVRHVTPPVRYLNRTGDASVSPASVPGTYFCAAFLNGDSGHASAGEVPLLVSVDVAGTAGEGAPTYDEAGAAPSESTAPEPDDAAGPKTGDAGGTPDMAASETAEGGGIPLWGWLLGVVAVLALALAVVARRTPRRVS